MKQSLFLDIFTLHKRNSPNLSINMQAQRRALRIKERLDIIEEIKSNPGISQKDIAKKFHLAPSTICKILQQESEFPKESEKENPNLKRQRNRKEAISGLSEILLKWFTSARNLGIPLSGPLIKEKACSIAASLGNSKFKASNGFLWKWLKRYNIT